MKVLISNILLESNVLLVHPCKITLSFSLTIEVHLYIL